MELEKEKFDNLKELAALQASISDARLELKDLHSTIEKYIEIREEEAISRINEALRESQEILEETTNNLKELAQYRDELKAFASDVKDFANHILTLSEGFIARTKDVEKEVDNRFIELTEARKLINAGRIVFHKERAELEREKKKIEDETRVLNDKRAALERLYIHLKHKPQ